MSSKTAIIVGAGVIGLSTAYHLARRKYGKIIVLDKGLAGDGSSSRAGGIITGLMWNEPSVLARKKALALYRDLSRELDGYRFQDVGCLNLFDPASWPERKALLPLYDRCQAPYEILSAADLRKRWPAIVPRDDFIGLHDPLGGYSEPHEYLPALVKKNRELGVEILEQQAVTGFIRRGDRIAGVKTNAAEFEGDAIVGTVYSWTRPLFERVGLQLPFKTFVHQRYVTRPLPEPLAIPAINANPLPGYIRPAHGNRLLLGASTPEREEFSVPSIDWHMSAVGAPAGVKETLMKNFRPFVPALAGVSWETEKVGLLTYSQDGEPILGPLARMPGLYLALAFHSGGFAYNPVAGFLMAEYIAEGKTSIDVSTFSPNRFEAQSTAAYLATTIRQKQVAARRH